MIEIWHEVWINPSHVECVKIEAHDAFKTDVVNLCIYFSSGKCLKLVSDRSHSAVELQYVIDTLAASKAAK